METEIAVKSEHLKQIKAQIEKLESEKYAVQDWVKKQEARVTEVNLQVRTKQDELAKSQAEHDKKKKASEGLLIEIGVKTDELNRKIAAFNHQQSILDEQTSNIKSNNNAMFAKQIELDRREAGVVKKEEYLKQVFDGLEKLKNA